MNLLPTTSRLTGWLAAIAIAASPGVVRADEPPAADEAPTPALPDLSGAWAQLQVTTALADIPIVGEVRSRTHTLLLLRIRQDGPRLDVRQTVCDIRIDSGSSAVDIVIPAAFLVAIPDTPRRAVLVPRGDSVDLSFPRQLQVLGAALPNPDTDALPREPRDARVVDADRDGHPGVSVRVRGLVSGEIRVVQRAWNVLRATTVHADRIDGTIDWGNEQVVLDATNPFVASQPDSRPDPRAGASWFRTTRVAENATCDDLQRNRKALFSR